MLIIRDAQRDLFREAARRQFEAALLQHLARRFPERLGPMGEPAARRLIGYGLSRMERWQIRRGPDAALWVTLMLYLGCDFDDDPLFPWAPLILSQAPGPEAQLAALRSAALEHLDRAEGADNQHLEAALARLRQEPLEELLPARKIEFEPWALERLEWLQPEKCRAVGQTALERLIAAGRVSARENGMHGDRATALFIGCMFMLGHGFHRDPQYPWLAPVFARSNEQASLKAYRLHRAALRHVEQQLVGRA